MTTTLSVVFVQLAALLTELGRWLSITILRSVIIYFDLNRETMKKNYKKSKKIFNKEIPKYFLPEVEGVAW